MKGAIRCMAGSISQPQAASRHRWTLTSLVIAAPLFFGSAAVGELAEGYDAYIKGDFEIAYREFLPIAQAGDRRAAYYLGLMHWDGKGVEKNIDDAVDWLAQAAAQGHTGAQLSLGLAYERGQGVERNDHLGAQWMSEAAAGGNSAAQYYLGIYYRDGRGIVQDHDAAYTWLERSLSTGASSPLFLDALIQLGVAREWGRGRAQDLIESYKWYALAAAHSSDDRQIFDQADRSMGALSTRMSLAQLAEARQRADNWRAP